MPAEASQTITDWGCFTVDTKQAELYSSPDLRRTYWTASFRPTLNLLSSENMTLFQKFTSLLIYSLAQFNLAFLILDVSRGFFFGLLATMPASNRRLLTVLVEIESSNSFLMAVEVSCLFLKLSHFIHLSVAAVVFLGRPDLGFLAGDPVSLNLFSTFDTPDWVPPTLLAISHCLTPS